MGNGERVKVTNKDRLVAEFREGLKQNPSLTDEERDRAALFEAERVLSVLGATQTASDRDELLKLRTGLARLAFKVGLADFVPGKPGREAPFEVLEKAADTNERGWNALIGVLMDEYDRDAEHVESLARERGWPGPEHVNATAAQWLANHTDKACAHCECPEAHEAPSGCRHTPGCESWQGKPCSCPPYSMEG